MTQIFSSIVIILNAIILLTVVGVGGHSGGDDDDHDRVSHSSPPPKLLVISFDGFRHDFIDSHDLVNFKKFRSNGCKADGMYSSYITKTFPNHHSIATGLYEESHGIVGNKMYDPMYKANFSSCTNTSSCGKWYGGDPIWNVNERESSGNRASGAIYWPGSDKHINGTDPTYIRTFKTNSSLSLRDRIDLMMSWFKNETKPINLGLLYYEEPDEKCHEYGPDDPNVTAVLKAIDQEIGYLMQKLKELNMDINVIILSDHGFTQVNKDPIYLDKCIDPTTYKLTDNNPSIMIWPNTPGLTEQIYKNLTKCSDDLLVFRKDSSELKNAHYTNNRRIAPIVLSTRPLKDGTAKMIFQSERQYWRSLGQHGWNNTWEKMHALFVANGPAFKKNHAHSTFENVNVYPLMCKVLELKCPSVNGSLTHVEDMLVGSSSHSTITVVVVVSLLCALIGGIFLIGFCHQQKNSVPLSQQHVGFGSMQKPGSTLPEQSTLLAESDDEF